MRRLTMLATASAMIATPALAADLNPVLWADVPDISITRNGDTYWMTSTTMHFCPQVPVMKSKDLVNWKIVSYCSPTLEDGEAESLENGKDEYMFGTWASSIRFHDGKFHVSTFNNRTKTTYVFVTDDPEKGKWEKHSFQPLVYDHSLWFEGDRVFMVGQGKSPRLVELEPDFSGWKKGGSDREIVSNVSGIVVGGLGEGSQFFKHDGWYYLFNICWAPNDCRTVVCHRSKNLEGPYEGKCVYRCEGIAQGGIVDTPDGKWYAYLFGDRGGVGRIPYLIPMAWQDGWPVIGGDGKTRPPLEIPGVVKDEVPGCCGSDDFALPALSLVWQWNHNPDNARWSLKDRPGWLRITTGRVDKDLLAARNTLTQRTFGPLCQGETVLDPSGMKPGDVAGLAAFQKFYSFVGVERTEKGTDVVMWGHDGRRSFEVARAPSKGGKVHLRATCDFRPEPNPSYIKIPASKDRIRFAWSENGNDWSEIGTPQAAPYSIPHFSGYRFALFCYATKQAGGHADFDNFRVAPGKPDQSAQASLVPDGTNPIIKRAFTPDPAAVVDGDTLYLFTGHDEPNARGYFMKDWQVFSTTNMTDWVDYGVVMTTAAFPWARQGDRAWASQAIKRNGKWYWYVAVQDGKTHADAIGVAVADKVEGPWTDPVGKPLLLGGRGWIDPSAFVDDDGQAWLFWGNCGGDPGCWYAPLKENMIELAGEVKPVPGLMDASAFGPPLKKKSGAGAYKPIDTNFEEAPWIYKVGDTYHLEYAAGGVPEHWAYSTAKSIHGPWTYRGRIMDEAEGTGTIHGGSVFFKGEWYLLYHNATLPGGADCRRSACIERYTRNPDGSIPHIKATRAGVSQPVQANSIPADAGR